MTLPFVRQQSPEVALLSLYIQPKASRNEIVRLHDGALKIAICAPPVDGKANAAVTAFLAATLGVPAKDIAITRGHNNRRKQFAVRGLSAEAIRQKLMPG
ncbi:MAG: DUF167 domain-containing protein [Desulfobulbaceae bacterium]|nr:DUF167 domain-containing protein [Desulfobulbaceae bacterium]